MISLEEAQKDINIASKLTDQELALIGANVVKGYELDETSRLEWKQVVDRAMDIARQKTERKNTPWDGASNIKYPLITQASIDYAARTLPAIIQNERVVRGVVQGDDPDDVNYARAENVSVCMSYQLMVQSPDWEDGMDKLLQILPVVGTVFKKTYYDKMEKRIVSEVCVPDKIVVNYKAPSLETARRITHILTMYPNDIVERQRQGIFVDDIDPCCLHGEYDDDIDNEHPLDILEQHCWLDLDEDGYKEPYIVTVHKQSQKVFRIVARFGDIQYKNGKVVCIKPDNCFTDYHFIRSPDGGFYSMGFGSLLLPLNSAINTLMNQLVDAGTLANNQGGFLGRGLRLKNGEFKFKMGEWKVLDAASGDDLGKNIYPMPVKEPSQTLFALLQLLMQVGKDLSSTTDLLKGKQPAQNVSNSVAAQFIEQGTIVFTAINKRVYRSLEKEYRKIYELNYKYLSNKEYRNILNKEDADVKTDFNLDDFDIHPIADPLMSSENQRLMKASVLTQLKTVDPRAADEFMLQTLNFEKSTIEKLLPPRDPNQPPPPEVMKIMAEIEGIKANVLKTNSDVQFVGSQVAVEQAKIVQSNKESEARIQEGMARVWKMQQDVISTRQKIEVAAAKMVNQEQYKAIDLMNRVQKNHSELNLKATKTAADSMKTIAEAEQIKKDKPEEVKVDDNQE